MCAVFARDAPFSDEWRLVPFIDKACRGGLGLEDFWAQNNEHRLIFPRLLMAALARVSGWDLRWETAASVLMAAALLAVFARMLRRAEISARWALPAASLLIFSLDQWGAWLGGLELCLHMTALAVAAGIALISESSGGIPLLAAVCGVVASYSFANGLLFWPIAAAVAAARRGGRRKAAAFLALGGAVGALYFIGYERPPAIPAPGSGGAGVSLAYIFMCLGAPICNYDRRGALLFGILGPACLAFLLRRRRRLDRLAPILGLAAYAALAAALTAVGRSGFGHPEQAMSSRYIVFSNGLWLCLAALFAAGARTRGAKLVAGFTAASCALSCAYGAAGFVYRSRQLDAERAELGPLRAHYVLPAPDPHPDEVAADALLLRRDGLSLYRGHKDPAVENLALPPITRGAVEGEFARSDEGGGRVKLEGWAGSLSSGRAARRIHILADDAYVFSGPTFGVRRDLAWRTRSLSMLHSGFAYVLTSDLVQGRRLRVVAESDDGKASELTGP